MSTWKEESTALGEKIAMGRSNQKKTLYLIIKHSKSKGEKRVTILPTDKGRASKVM